jgi:hypothetical protein
MGVADIRDAFNNAIKDGSVRCEACRMYYAGANRQLQVVEFDIVRPSDGARTVLTTPAHSPLLRPDEVAADAAKAAASAFPK